jgi:outer membrane protein assembly factor BamB
MKPGYALAVPRFAVTRSRRVRLAVPLLALAAACSDAPFTNGGGDADAGTTADAGPQGPPAWPVFQRTSQNTGASLVNVAEPLEPAWALTSIRVSGQPLHTVAVGAGDVAYAIADASTSGVTTLLAANADGTEAWARPLAPAPSDGAGIVVGDDGTVYAMLDQAGTLFAFDPAGNPLWQAATTENARSFTQCGGVLYATFEAGTLAALDPASGATTWTASAGSEVSSLPACSADGSTIYVAAQTPAQIVAFGTDGTPAWTVPLPSAATSPPVVGGDGTAYVGTLDGHVVAVSPAGAVAWSTPLPFSATGIALGGTTLAVAASDLASSNFVYGLSTAGAVVWSAALAGVPEIPIATPDGEVIVADDAGNLDVIDATGKVVETLPFGVAPVSYGLAVAASGLVLAGSGDGTLVAFGGP